jgi:hypothetical protein
MLTEDDKMEKSAGSCRTGTGGLLVVKSFEGSHRNAASLWYPGVTHQSILESASSNLRARSCKTAFWIVN